MSFITFFILVFALLASLLLNYRDFLRNFSCFLPPPYTLCRDLSLYFKITYYSQVSFIYILSFFLLPVLDPAYCWPGKEKHESSVAGSTVTTDRRPLFYLVLLGWRETAGSMDPEPDCLVQILTSSVTSCNWWPLAGDLTLQCLRVFICKMRIKMALNSQGCYGDKFS